MIDTKGEENSAPVIRHNRGSGSSYANPRSPKWKSKLPRLRAQPKAAGQWAAVVTSAAWGRRDWSYQFDTLVLTL